MRASYYFGIRPASFDFWVWLTTARTKGATKVVFDTSGGFKYGHESQESQERMFRNVVIPICELFGMDWEEGLPEEDDITCCHDVRTAIRHQPLDLPQFELEDGPPTITLRNSFKHKERNSKREEWERFAGEVGAIIIEDAYQAPISIKDRFDLYRQASMNYFVSNGPGIGCIFSNIPVMLFETPKTRPLSIPHGTQYPWSTPLQRLIYRDDTYENIRKTHEEWMLTATA